MFGFTMHSFPAGAVLRPHSHEYSQLCWLLKGEIVQICAVPHGAARTAHYRCGNLWKIDKTDVHSATVLEESRLLTCRLGWPRKQTTRYLSAAALAMLAIHAARACDYGLAELERDKATGLRITVPDCFFDQLESAAAGGDSQAQLELGITYMEGYSRDPADINLGPYWIKKAMSQGHPSAKNILDSYMEDYSC